MRGFLCFKATKKERQPNLMAQSRLTRACTVSLYILYEEENRMSNYKLVAIDQRFIAETIAMTDGEKLMNKVSRNFVVFYNDNWCLPIRFNLKKINQ